MLASAALAGRLTVFGDPLLDPGDQFERGAHRCLGPPPRVCVVVPEVIIEFSDAIMGVPELIIVEATSGLAALQLLQLLAQQRDFLGAERRGCTRPPWR